MGTERAVVRDGIIITFVSPKGGTGKSTTMLALMGAIHEDEPDARVLAMDMDPQHTITEILATRTESGTDVSWFDVYSLPGAEHLSAKDILALCDEKREQYDYILVDTQGAARKEALYFTTSADVALITSKYNSAELGPSALFYNEVLEVVESWGGVVSMYFLETRMSKVAETKETRGVRTQFAEMGYPELKTRIPALAAFENMSMYGLFLHELAAEQDRPGNLSAAQVCRDLWSEIREILREENDE